MAFQQISGERLSDKVVRSIMEQIRSGALQPGQKLPNELEFAEELGVSRGILREALTVLQARDYICRKPKDGTFVNPAIRGDALDDSAGITLKKATYQDLLEMRECVEQRTAEKVIDRASNEEIEELYGLVTEENVLEEDGSGRSLDYYFHYRLAQLSHNTMFVNFIDTYYDVINEMTKQTTKDEARKKEIRQEHLDIVNAIRAHNKEAARTAVMHHLRMVKVHIEKSGADD